MCLNAPSAADNEHALSTFTLIMIILKEMFISSEEGKLRAGRDEGKIRDRKREREREREGSEPVTSLLPALTGVITLPHSPSPLGHGLWFNPIASAVYLPLFIVSVRILIHPSRLHL